MQNLHNFIINVYTFVHPLKQFNKTKHMFVCTIFSNFYISIVTKKKVTEFNSLIYEVCHLWTVLSLNTGKGRHLFKDLNLLFEKDGGTKVHTKIAHVNDNSFIDRKYQNSLKALPKKRAKCSELDDHSNNFHIILG